MAISYPLSLPTTIGISSVTLRASNVSSISESPFTFRQQVFKHPGERWSATVVLPQVTRDYMEDWVAFLLSLRGAEGTFYLNDPQCATARGSASVTPGTPLVRGASQTGNTVNIDGLPNSVTGYFKAGDYMQISTGSSSRLYKVLTDTNSNGSGQATVDIWPAIRTAHADNAAIAVASAKGLFRLQSNTVEWTINYDNSYNLQFDAVEVVP